MKEADRTTLFLKWAKARLPQTFVAEAKICKEKSLPLATVKPHQESALYLAKHGTMNHKIADGGYSQTPFDLFQVFQVPAYVVIFWYTKPGDRRMALIDIDQWLEEREKYSKKSIDYERACEIGRCEVL